MIKTERIRRWLTCQMINLTYEVDKHDRAIQKLQEKIFELQSQIDDIEEEILGHEESRLEELECIEDIRRNLEEEP